MRVADFSFDLPDELIARPVPVEKINDELEKIYQNKSIYQQ